MAERVASRTTENGTTLVLERRKTDFDWPDHPNAKYEYYVKKAGGGRVSEDFPTKEQGMRDLRESVKDFERAAELEEQESGRSRSGGMAGLFGGGGGGQPSMPAFGGGMGGGSGGPMLPGFGMAPEDDDDDEDSSGGFAWMP